MVTLNYHPHPKQFGTAEWGWGWGQIYGNNGPGAQGGVCGQLWRSSGSLGLKQGNQKWVGGSSGNFSPFLLVDDPTHQLRPGKL